MSAATAHGVVAFVALSAGFAAWQLRPPPPLEDGPLPPPEPTSLNAAGCDGTPWPKAATFTEEQREAFERDGFIVLRNFVTPAIVAALVRELRHVCKTWPGPMDPKFQCFRTGTWLRSDASRDFLYYGPVGETVSNLLQVPSIRIQEDGYFVHSEGHKGQPWHTDMDQYGGVFSEFHRKTRGVAVWIALTDIDHERTGGSVLVTRGGPKTNCSGKTGHWSRRQPPLAAVKDSTCEERINNHSLVHSFRAGDAMMWHPWMPHRTQLSTQERLSWYARVVEGDAIFCNHEYRAKSGNRQALCQHALQPGQRAHHVCFQQIYPLLPQEIAERMRSDWYTPILQPTSLGNLRYKLSTWWNGFLMTPRRGLWSAPTLEKPACID